MTTRRQLRKWGRRLPPSPRPPMPALFVLTCALVGAAAGIGASMLGWYSGPEWHTLSLPFPPGRAVYPACLGACWGAALAAWVVG